MKIIFKILMTLIAILIVSMGYLKYTNQKEKRHFYQSHLALMLQSYCIDTIQNSFHEHATLFDITKDKYHVRNGVEYHGNSMKIKGYSTIYFEGFAPQDISCIAEINLDKKIDKISLKKIIKINNLGIDYLPPGYSNPKSLKLTIEELNKLYPLGFGATLSVDFQQL